MSAPTETRILLATIALIVILSAVMGGHGIWDFAWRPMP